MKVTLDCYSERSGYVLRQLIVTREGRLHRHFVADAKGCKQWYDTDYTKDLVKLTYDVLQKEVIFTDLYTLTRSKVNRVRDLKFAMDGRILEWMKHGDNDDLLKLYRKLTGIETPATKPTEIFNDLKEVYRGWSSTGILKGVRPSFNVWLDGEVFANAKFTKVSSVDMEMYVSAEPLIALDELGVNLCPLEPGRRILPRYDVLLRIVGDSKIARTLLNTRIKHCGLKEHEGIPEYIVLTALRYNDVVPNQICYIYQGEHDHDPEVIERYSHNTNYSLVQTIIPRKPTMTKVVVVTRKPVMHAGVRQSVGYYVDVYYAHSKKS